MTKVIAGSSKLASSITKSFISIAATNLLCSVLALATDLTTPLNALIPAAIAGSAQESAPQKLALETLDIGGVFYFACDGINLKKIKQIMTVKEGDIVQFSPREMGLLKKRLLDAVHTATDDEPSDIAIVASDKVCYCYVGLRGKNLDDSTISIGSVGARSHLKVPEKIQSKYLEILQADLKSSAPNSGTDKLKANLVRDEIIKEAMKCPDELLQVSLNSSDALHRRMANFCLGLIANNKEQLEALAKATHDSDVAVRNEAIATLMLMAQKPALQALVPAVQFIPLLNSAKWSERNKGVELVALYTKSRQPQFIEELKKQALPSLKEMAGWDADHARPALLILGRIAGIADEKLNPLVAKGDKTAILAALGQGSAAKESAKEQAKIDKNAKSAQKLVSKLADGGKGGASPRLNSSSAQSASSSLLAPKKNELANGFYLVLREYPDNKHVRASNKNEVVLVNDYKFLAPEERETAEYLVVDKTQFVPFDLKSSPNKQTDERGRPKLLVTLKDTQVKPLEDFTRKNAGHHVVIVVGGDAVTKHKIREPIKGGLIQITRCTDNGCEAIYTELTKSK